MNIYIYIYIYNVYVCVCVCVCVCAQIIIFAITFGKTIGTETEQSKVHIKKPQCIVFSTLVFG